MRQGEEKEKRAAVLTDGRIRLICDIGAVIVGFLLAGRHFVFSSYPLGIAFVAALPMGVWPALLGAALGSLTLGKSGIIYSMICVLVVFLRVVISGVEKTHGDESTVRGRSFSESIPLRICAAVIGSFVIGVYEILLGGLSFSSVSFALCTVGFSVLAVPVIATVFGSGVGMRDFLFGHKSVFRSEKRGREGLKALLFKISVAVFVFFISFSLEPYRFFGIDAGLIFSAAVTLFAARRFGWLYALACGFISSFGITGLYSVSFALMGAVSGALFPFGIPYALVGGGAVLAAWGAYAGGATGVVSVIPEYIISAALSFPLYSYLKRERSASVEGDKSRMATDMVGTMALAYRNGRESALSELCRRVSAGADAIRDFKEYADSFAEGYLEALTQICRIMNEVAQASDREREMNEDMTEGLEEVFSSCGFPDGVIRAFGDRRTHVICAGEDSDGMLITSDKLKAGLEEKIGAPLLPAEYFRRQDMVLMECEAAPIFKVEGAYASRAGGAEISGDSIRLFETPDKLYCAMIADGMGSGEIARRTAELSSSFSAAMLGTGAGISGVLSMVNTLVKHGIDECSVAIDTFIIDLMRPDARFIKSGAAPSFIKRGTSLFRISSRTLPMGVLGGVDAEEIRSDVHAGDTVFMFSDGVCDGHDGAAWLIELLGGNLPQGAEQIAEYVLKRSAEQGRGTDDMSVVVLKIHSSPGTGERAE